ncbi:hypothetical protein [Corynebacterium freiburgense]|uniref:hypothetical protein n=1 Tax=Corynebacterium freiburgense TaxID=556548 RepID=UPI0004279D99|nr:hypothetical protein [Corynebacterium freiburgense]WJZ01588.1 hypothetical protein CFREI_01400 [Corynebacterium freiburgense]
MNLRNLIIASVLGVGLTLQMPMAFAADNYGTYRVSEDSQNLEFKISKEYKFEKRDDGAVDVINKSNRGVKETLPTEIKGENTEKVSFDYKVQSDNKLLVSVIDKEKYTLEILTNPQMDPVYSPVRCGIKSTMTDLLGGVAIHPIYDPTNPCYL